MSKERKLNTDGKRTYNILKSKMQVENKVIDYGEENHRLYFLNKIVSNLSNQLIDRFHGVTKKCYLYIILNLNGDLTIGKANLF